MGRGQSSFRVLLIGLVATAFVLWSAIIAALPAAAQTAGEPTDAVIATFETADGSTFRALLERPEDIARAEAALDSGGNAGIPNGELVEGDGGVNAPHDWHVVNIELVDVTLELCDATATMVDEDLDYWINTVGRFCPWNATLTALDAPVQELPNTGIGSTANNLSPVAPIAATAVLLLFPAIAARTRSRRNAS